MNLYKKYLKLVILSVSVGKPIDVVQEENPSKEVIDTYHKLYVDQLIELFDTYKTNYEVSKDTKLKII